MTYLLGGTKPASHQDILAAFPPKPTADLLVTRYFNTYDPAFRKYLPIAASQHRADGLADIIHAPTFQKQVSNQLILGCRKRRLTGSSTIAIGKIRVKPR